MNGKLWKYVMIAVLLFDLGLVAVRVGSTSEQVRAAVPQIEALQQSVQEISFDPGSVRTQSVEKLTVTAIFLLTAIALM